MQLEYSRKVECVVQMVMIILEGKIYDDAAMWVERFMISLNSGGTINTAIDYANSYLYPHSSSKAYYIALGNASYKI